MLQIGFLIASIVVLLVRASHFMDRFRNISLYAESFKSFSVDCNKILLDVRRQRKTAGMPLERYEDLKNAEEVIKDVQQTIGPNAQPWVLTLYRLATYIDFLLDLFGVMVMLILAAILMNVAEVDMTTFGILFGVNILASLIFPHILEKAQTRCKVFAMFMEMRLAFADALKDGEAPFSQLSELNTKRSM